MTGRQLHVLPGGGPDIAYGVCGHDGGRPLVLLHGLSADSTSWAPVIDRVGSTWRTYTLDFRGHGRSARTPGAYRLDDYLTDTDRLLQVIGEPAVVVGHSLGAIVATALAQDGHPQVAAVFLEDPLLYLVEPSGVHHHQFRSSVRRAAPAHRPSPGGTGTDRDVPQPARRLAAPGW